MIIKPCPRCEQEDASCGHAPYFETECRNCGARIFGREPANRCHECTSSIVLEDPDDGPTITIAPQLADKLGLDE